LLGSGSGCPDLGEGFFNASTMYVPCTYVIYDGQYYKIGRTHCLFNRLLQIRTHNPRPLRIVALYSSYNVEVIYHKALKDYFVSGEWFECPPKVINRLHATIDKELVIDIDRLVFSDPINNNNIFGRAGLTQAKFRQVIKDALRPISEEIAKRERKMILTGNYNDYIPF
jgi:hypothetical protein